MKKGKTIEAFFEPLKLRREDYFSTLKQSYPDFEERIRTLAIVVKNNQFKRINVVSEKIVILLTYIFQNYIDTCKSAYGINPLYSYSTPSFTWKAGLKYTGVQFDFLTDDRLRLLLENNICGGPSSWLGNRHVKRGERNVI